MSEKFSPGPWMVPHFATDGVDCNCASILSEAHCGAVATIGIDNGKNISDGGNGAPPLDEAKANARLIASAPEMHDALKAMVDRWEPDCIGADRIMWENACAALSKARGEAP